MSWRRAALVAAFGRLRREAELEGECGNVLFDEAVLIRADEANCARRSGAIGRLIVAPTARASAPRLLSSAPRAMIERSGKSGSAMS